MGTEENNERKLYISNDNSDVFEITEMLEFNPEKQNDVKYKIDINDFDTLTFPLSEEAAKTLNKICKEANKKTIDFIKDLIEYLSNVLKTLESNN